MLNIILEILITYPKQMGILYNELPFLPEEFKINKQVNLICSFNGKEKYVAQTKKITLTKSLTKLTKTI